MGAGPANLTTFNDVTYMPYVEPHRVMVGRHPYDYYPACCNCGTTLTFATEAEAEAWADRHEAGGR